MSLYEDIGGGLVFPEGGYTFGVEQPGGASFDIGGGVGKALSGVGDLFGAIWDRTQGVIGRIADVELLDRELDLFSAYQANQAAIERANNPSLYGGSMLSAGSLMPLLLIGGVVLIGVVLLTD